MSPKATCQMGSEAAVRAAAETPVFVQFSVEHDVIAGMVVGAVALDRSQAESHLRTLGQCANHERFVFIRAPARGVG